MKSFTLALIAVLLIMSLTLGISCSSTPSTVVTTATTTATTTAVSTQTTTSTTTTTNTVKVTKLIFANWAPPPNALSVASHKWAADFEAKTGGRYTVEVVDGGAIASNGKTPDAILNGICDIGNFAPKESDKPFPLVNMSTLPVGFVTNETAFGAWHKMFLDGVFNKDLADFKPLFTFLGNNEDVSTKKAINSVAEFKGVKLVVPGGTQVDITLAVGAIPVTGGPPDAYELVSKGVADGIYIAALGMQEFQWVDVVKYLIKPMQFGKASHVVAMNKDADNKMPADVKAIVDGMVKDPQYGLAVAKGWDEWWNGSIKYFHEKGGTDIDWNQTEKDKLGALILPMWNKWIKDNEASGSKAGLTAYYNAMKAVGVADPTPGWKP